MAILATTGAPTRQKSHLQIGGFLAFRGIFCGRIKSKGLALPSSFLVRLRSLGVANHERSKLSPTRPDAR